MPAATPLIMISDPGQDLDDEMALIMCRQLIHLGLIELRGVVTTLTPAFARARLARGTLDHLGLHHVPVAIGSDGGDTSGQHTAAAFEESAASYMPTPGAESSRSMESGRRLLRRLYIDAAPRSLTLLVIASMKDAALFARDFPALFAEKTREVVIMGGCKPMQPADDAAGSLLASDTAPVFLEPDTANNNTFDMVSAKFFYRRCQEAGISLVVVSRFAAYAAKMPRSSYDELALTGALPSPPPPHCASPREPRFLCLASPRMPLAAPCRNC